MSELEQFLILAKTQKGRALDMMIQQVISHKKIFTFGELLAIPRYLPCVNKRYVFLFVMSYVTELRVYMIMPLP